jgi:4-hydroxy-tetrahydrodipicolinate reductase
MKHSVVVNGAFGRMGTAAVNAINLHSGLTLIGSLGKEHDLNRELLRLKPDIVVDLTHAEFGPLNTEIILQAGCRPVIGTSGFTEENVRRLEAIARQVGRGGIIAPNFSIGAVLMMKYAREISRYFSNVEIVETHHEKKLDAPSGTALKTAEMIAQVRGEHEISPRALNIARDSLLGAQGAEHAGVKIHSLRLPGHLAHQKVIFGAPGEALTVQHDAISRECYMPGICFACEHVMETTTLIYGLEHIF